MKEFELTSGELHETGVKFRVLVDGPVTTDHIRSIGNLLHALATQTEKDGPSPQPREAT
jgi:hypothetical protein